jgi:hypothetical protein
MSTSSRFGVVGVPRPTSAPMGSPGLEGIRIGDEGGAGVSALLWL